MSLKGILLLFQEPQVDFATKPTKFYNPMIQKVSTTIEGLPNQLYAQGLQRRQHWEEASKYFQDGRDPETMGIIKALKLGGLTPGEYLTKHYAMWLDLRSVDDNSLPAALDAKLKMLKKVLFYN